MKIFWPSLKKLAYKPDLTNKILFTLCAMNESTIENYGILSFIVKKTIITADNIY